MLVFPIGKNGIRMKSIAEEYFPVVRDIDDHIDKFEEIGIVWHTAQVVGYLLYGWIWLIG